MLQPIGKPRLGFLVNVFLMFIFLFILSPELQVLILDFKKLNFFFNEHHQCSFFFVFKVSDAE